MQFIYIKWNFENNKLFVALLLSIETTTLVEALLSLYPIDLPYWSAFNTKCRILPIVSLSFETLTKKGKNLLLFNRKKECVSEKNNFNFNRKQRETGRLCVFLFIVAQLQLIHPHFDC